MAANVFPYIQSQHIISQLPYEEQEDWLTTVSMLDCGATYSWSYNADDDAKIRGFKVNYPAITPTEAQVLENFFTSMRGSLGLFSFTDDDSVTWTNCRFGTDTFQLQYPQPGIVSIALPIIAEHN